MKLKNINLIILFIIFFNACGDSSSTSTNNSNTVFDLEQKEYLYSLFNSEYYWSNDIEKNKNNIDKYTNAKEMINELKYAKDKWSYSQTYVDYLDKSNQKTSGFGCFFINFPQVAYTRIDSPCYKVGIKRGDYINFINGLNSTGLYNNAQENLKKEVEFTVNRKGSELKINITPLEYKYKVSEKKILLQDGKKIAFFRYDSFTSSSNDEINEAFTYFKTNSVDELIIDLRYNGGGSINTASIFMDKIAAYKNENKVQIQLKWNNNYSKNNSFYRFSEEVDENSLKNLSRVYFLTTSNSASASEMMINALKPYIDVKVIGKTSHGKPVGMRGKIKKGLIYWLINFEAVNAKDEGGYYNGITPDCFVDDDLNYLRGEKEEPLLKKALFYIKNNSCS